MEKIEHHAEKIVMQDGEKRSEAIKQMAWALFLEDFRTSGADMETFNFSASLSEEWLEVYHKHAATFYDYQINKERE